MLPVIAVVDFVREMTVERSSNHGKYRLFAFAPFICTFMFWRGGGGFWGGGVGFVLFRFINIMKFSLTLSKC